MKNDFLKIVSVCWNLESLDITGCTQVDDQGISALAKGEAQLRVGLPPALPGLIKLITLKVGHTKMTDFGLGQIIKACPNLQHLELNRCELTDAGVKHFAKELP